MIVRRIVCAAIRHSKGQVICSPRHFDGIMRAQVMFSPLNWTRAEQGFVDQNGEFLNRKDARIVALEANQIMRRVGGDGDALYSENLY